MVAMTHRLLRTDSMHCSQTSEAESRVIANRFDTSTSRSLATSERRAAPVPPAHTSPRARPAPARAVPGNGFYKARHEIGRPDFRFHDLRHFAATMVAISGATTKELMQFAGHSDIHAAMRYQEAVTNRKRELAHRMTALANAVAPETEATT
jgi:integrase